MNRFKHALLAVSGVTIVIAFVVLYKFATYDKSPIPPTVQDRLTFSPFVLTDKAQHLTATDYKFSSVEDNTHILTYQLHFKDQRLITVSEYTQPPQFAEIPDYKDRFLNNIAKQYDTVPTASGTIYLGRLARQNNQQVAVMIERGLLVFMNPDKEMLPAEWRSIGDQLEIQRVVN